MSLSSKEKLTNLWFYAALVPMAARVHLRRFSDILKPGPLPPGSAHALGKAQPGWLPPRALTAAFTVALGGALTFMSAAQHDTPDTPRRGDTGAASQPYAKPGAYPAALTAQDGDDGDESAEITIDGHAADTDDNVSADSIGREKALSHLLFLPRQDDPDAQQRIIREIQLSLNALNLYPGRVDGRFGAMTANAVVNFLQQKPERLAGVSTYHLERLIANGQSRALKRLAHGNTSALGEAMARIEMLGPDSTRDQHRAAQTWMKVIGVYNASLDGLRGAEQKRAEQSLRVLALGNEPGNRTLPENGTDTATAPQPDTAPVLEPRPPRQIYAALPMTAQDIHTLQDRLKKAGHFHVRPTGTFGPHTAGALMSWLDQNNHDIPNLSSWMVQQLIRHGHQKKLSDMILSNPDIWDKTSHRMMHSLANYETLPRGEVIAMQSWMMALALYNGPANGVRNDGTKHAANMLEYYLSTADMHTVIRYARSLGDGTSADNTHSSVTALARNPAFRRALAAGDMGRVVRHLDSLDSSPLVLGKPVDARINSSFGARFHPVHRQMRMHQGVDIAARSGTPIRASSGGRVVFAGALNGYGNTVIVDHGRDVLTLYAHMNRIRVKPGDTITADQRLGTVGQTGVATGPHLHFEVILRDQDGIPRTVDAARLINRDIADPQVQIAALSNAFSQARSQRWGQDRTYSHVVRTLAPAGQTPMTHVQGRLLLQVLASDRTLLRDVPKDTLAQLNRLGFRQQLVQLAEANPNQRRVNLAL